MALFNAWCDSADFSVGTHFLHTITARDADFTTGVGVMASHVPEHYASPQNIAFALEKLGKPGAASYLSEKLPQTKQIRSGDLGEIFATEWINVRGKGFSAPVKRLRWRDHRNMAMRGEDVVGVYVDKASQKLFFLKTEAKSRTSMTSKVITEARECLDKDNGLVSPHALIYLAERLNEQDDDELAGAILNTALNEGYTKDRVRHLLFLLSGNASEKMLATSMGTYAGQVHQWGVSFRINRHGEFIAATYEKVIANARHA